MGSTRETYSTFLRCQVNRYARECTGVRRCEHLSPELQGLSHTHATESIFEYIRDIHTQLIQRDTTMEERRSRRHVN